MATLDENKVLSDNALDQADVSRVVDACVTDPIGFAKELIEGSPGGFWANRVCAMLLYLLHKENGDDVVTVGTDDDFATQGNFVTLLAVGNSMSVRNTANTAYAAIRPSQIVLGSFGTFIGPVNGDPEGAISAVPGSLALRTDGGAGTTLYVKESGTGSTGWVAK
jgi:hypothetical protein